MPYASTGGALNANKCVFVSGNNEPGESCLYSGVVESTDDCDDYSFCLQGVCTAFCEGTINNPICEPGYTCLIANNDSITLCVPR